MGSMPVPSDLDIRRPSGAWMTVCTFTRENGTSPVNSSPIITIRATHRKRMSRAVGPAERRERPQLAREPRVEHVRVALPAVALRRLRADVDLVAPVPDGDLVAPPELARDAPGPDVLQPLHVAAALALRLDRQAAVAHGL